MLHQSTSNIPIPPFHSEGVTGQKLPTGRSPQHIVVVRLHAFGDTVISIPLLAGLRHALPTARIDVVTGENSAPLFHSFPWLDHVFSIPECTSKVKRMAAIAQVAAQLGRPELVLDIQHSRPSQLLRRLLHPLAYVEFDRFAPKAALDRYMEAACWVGLDNVEPVFEYDIVNHLKHRATELLVENNPSERNHESHPLVCLNPAGCWPTKNWPIEYYIELGQRMVREWDARIVLMGTDNVRVGAAQIANALGPHVTDLVGKTTTAEALAVVRQLRLMVSDDSGLMHLAWVLGIPTIAMFGASRSTWSKPCGAHTHYFGSEDLSCGACMSPTCARHDLHCLHRVDVDWVFELGNEIGNSQ